MTKRTNWLGNNAQPFVYFHNIDFFIQGWTWEFGKITFFGICLGIVVLEQD